MVSAGGPRRRVPAKDIAEHSDFWGSVQGDTDLHPRGAKMLAVPQLGFWLSLCVAVGASAIVPDRVTAHTDFSAGKTPNSYSALTARIVIDQVRYSRIDVPDREFGTADNG